MQKITKTCSTCGSEDVFVDASVIWDVGQQCWKLESDHDVITSDAFCQDCNVSCTLKDKVMEEAPSPNMVYSWDAASSHLQKLLEESAIVPKDPSAFEKLYQANFNDLENLVVIDSFTMDEANIAKVREIIRHDSLIYGGTISGRYKQTKPPFHEIYGNRSRNQTILDEYAAEQKTIHTAAAEREIHAPESVDSYLENQCRNTPPDPLIHGKMSADKVLMRTDRDAMFPKFHADFTAGKAILTGGSQPGCDAHDAQDRVILRRHLRKHFPQAVKRVDLKSLGLRDLKAMVNTLKNIDNSDRYDG